MSSIAEVISLQPWAGWWSRLYSTGQPSSKGGAFASGEAFGDNLLDQFRNRFAR